MEDSSDKKAHHLYRNRVKLMSDFQQLDEMKKRVVKLDSGKTLPHPTYFSAAALLSAEI